MAKKPIVKTSPKVDDTMFYYATANQPNEPWSGPYVAKVTKVMPAVEAVDGAKPEENHPGSPLMVDLEVRFGDTPAVHRKTSVRVTDEPELHCASPAPEVDFDKWIREVAKEPQESPESLAT